MDHLRAEVAGHRGRARTGPLLRLGQALSDRYWRAGPGQPAARAYLDEIIEVLTEAYGYFEAADAWRGQVAAMLGQQHAIRALAHAGPDEDRVKAIPLLEEGLAFERLPPALMLPSLMMLGQVHLMPAALIGGSPAGIRRAVDRAEDCFRQALAAPQLGSEVTQGIRTMLEMVEILRGLAGVSDPAKMLKSVQRLRDVQKSGSPIVLSPLQGDLLAQLDPLDRPVAVVDVPSAATPAPVSTRRPIPEPDVGDARRALRVLLPHPQDPVASAQALLHDTPARSRTDELVALTVAIAAREPDDGPNQLLLAVALRHRSRIGPGGWPGADDLTAARQALRTAIDLLQPLDALTDSVTRELSQELRA
ncbi:hypothetical protein AB0J83_46085 [Actinoplanes sp. NPDC049596]|uniref:hypothetical protein n=1 Tax=unclassified Actinoplanes TaxID=2626549 RepID=UPI003414B23A